ncbi:HpcH/HpaI aldolase/citrate lyase family protein [Burkholderia multivorans]|uniref:HpcH/HpaI aldolase/citrate lyase family protein n=1 Tax=Burkholderia multivorans TaxID=87883 RepID=UPI001C241FB9|nr:CoA ester lyase [Burkholderia multivorans]MBU9480670.1 CoA ester lyase [Burkholderia multivorans]
MPTDHIDGLLPRSWLFVPGTRLDLLEKAFRAEAHAVIVDLEDAVLPEHKLPARRAIAQLPAIGALYVRVNAVGTSDFPLDVAAAKQANASGVVLPKVERREDLDALLELMPEPIRVVVLIETARGLANLAELASHPAVHRIAFGGVDFALDVGCAADSFTMRSARSSLVLGCRAAGLPAPIDGVTVSIETEVLERDAQDARAMGFGGKLCIHPRQIACTNQAFLPSDEEVTWAKRIIEQAGRADAGAILVDGQMVDRPVLERAKRVLAETR